MEIILMILGLAVVVALFMVERRLAAIQEESRQTLRFSREYIVPRLINLEKESLVIKKNQKVLSESVGRDFAGMHRRFDNAEKGLEITNKRITEIKDLDTRARQEISKKLCSINFVMVPREE